MQISENIMLDLCASVFSPGAELDYFRSRLFACVETKAEYTVDSLMENFWQHPRQLIASDYIDGCYILNSLVEGLNSAEANEGTLYRCRVTDGIQGHLGVTFLEFLKMNWEDLSPEFRHWASDKRLYALADTFWGDDGEIYMPFFKVFSGKPEICAEAPNNSVFGKKDVFLKV